MKYELIKRFFLHTSSSYDKVVAITTFNRDKVWKKHILALVPNDTNYCLDLGCGTGILTTMLKTKAKNVIGLDLIYDSLVIAKAKNNEVLQSVAEYLPFKDKCMDVIVTSYVPKYCEPKLTIKECARVLKNQGVLIMHDFTYPSGFVRLLWHLYFKILKFVGRFTIWRDVFNELDILIKQSNWIEELRNEMERNGFRCIKCKYLTMNTSAILYARLDEPNLT